jgi:RNA-binding protein
MKFAHSITIRTFENSENFELNQFMIHLIKLFPKEIEETILFDKNNDVWNGLNLSKEFKNYLVKEKCELEIEEIKSKNALKGSDAKIVDGIDITKIQFVINKDKHINYFFQKLKEELGKKQCELIISQENRIDDNCNLFIRIDKTELIEKNKFVLTESGNCFHIKIKLACYPNKKETALKVVKEIFN